MAVTNLNQYYQSIGKPLPPITERAKIFETAGLGKATSYIGSAAQNASLLTHLTTPDPKAPTAPTAPVAPGTTTPAPTTTVPATAGKQKQATLWGPAGEKEVVDVGSQRASELQNRGWTLTVDQARGKSKSVLTGPNGEKRTVYAGTNEEKSLLEKGYTAASNQSQTTTSSPVATSSPARVFDQNGQPTSGLPQPEIPTAPNFSEILATTSASLGIPDLQTHVNTLDDQIRTLQESFRQGLQQTSNRLAPMSVIGGEQRQLQEQFNSQLNTLTLQKQALVDQLNTKVATVNQIMQMAQLDYSTATDRYDREYKASLDAFNTFNTQKSQQQAAASANLSTIVNMMKDAGKNWNDIDTGMRTNITQLEMQSGLPAGTIRSFIESKPGSKLLTTVNGTNSKGQDVTTFIYADKNGLPGTVRTVLTGGVEKPKVTPTTDTTNVSVEKMTSSQLKADYNQSIAGLAGKVQTKAGQASELLTADIPGTNDPAFKKGQPLTREAAAQLLFTYYKGRVSLTQIKNDIYKMYK